MVDNHIHIGPQRWHGGTWGLEERILAGLDYTNVKSSTNL